MALGKIVIADYNSGVAGLIKNGVNGFVIDTQVLSQILDLLQSIINKSAAVDEISRNAILSINHLTWECAAENHYQAYADLHSIKKAKAI